MRVAIVMLPMMLLSFWTFAQSVLVKGTITDEGKNPIPGANVVIKGTTAGIVTDANGKYQIETDAKSTLYFTYLTPM